MDSPECVYQFYRQNDYGIREPLLEQAHRLLRKDELRALALRFQDDARQTVAAANSGEVEHYQVFGASSAMGLVARALRDTKLYEQSILVHSPKPNGLQANGITKQYLRCEDAAGALRWLGGDYENNAEFERLDLLDRAYQLSGDRVRQIETREEIYRRAPGIHSHRALEGILPVDERGAFRARACQDAKCNPHVATAAELLFAPDEPSLAEQLIVERSANLDGRTLLTSLERQSGTFLKKCS